MNERPMIACYERDEDGVEVLVHREANEAELADIQAREKEDLDRRRSKKQAEIEQALAASDVHVLRAYEGGVPVGDDVKAHRESLRELHAKAAKSKAPEKLDVPALTA